MKLISPKRRSKILLLAGMLALSVQGISQNPSLKVFEQWRSDAGTQNTFYKASTVIIPGTINSIVCGATLNTNGDYDIFVERLNGAGSVVWSYQYDGPGNGDDVATDVYYDAPSGWTFVVGSYFESSADSFNAIVMGFKPNGALDWDRTYNGTGSGADGFVSIAGDPSSGEIYCTGTEWEGISMYDVLAIKYDIGGNMLWTTTYDYMSMVDGGCRFALGPKPAILAAVMDTPTDFLFGAIQFDPSTGAISGTSFGGGTAMAYDQPADITSDDSGNIYLAGTVFNGGTLADIRVTKYDTLLNIVWQNDFDGGYTMNDCAAGIALDSHNNVLVCGTMHTVNNGMNYAILKFTNGGAGGYMTDYDDPYQGDDSATAIVVDPNDTNGIYVTGYSFNGSTKDYWTMKISGAGIHTWEIGMNSILNGNDVATAIALDTLGDVIVAGQVKLADTVYAYTTVKYIQKNTLLAEDTIPHVSSSFVFTENRGQVLGTDSALHPEVKFYTMHGAPNIYFMDTVVSYVFTKLDTAAINDTVVRVDMKFKNSNADQKIRSLNARSEYNNFFLPHTPGGRSHVQNFNQLASFNVWNNVDIIYGSNLKGLKYYFICKPGGGGNPATQIDLKYYGADSVKINGSGQLVIYTKLGNIVQPKAAAWQLDATGNYQSLGWQPSYTLLGTNEVGFTGFGSFNTAYPLVIAVDWGNIFSTSAVDNLWWSTYWGDQGGDLFLDVTTDAVGRPYYAGFTNDPNFPYGQGMSTTVPFGGNNDAVVIKIDTACGPVWTNFFGGTASDVAWGVTTDIHGNVIICGQSASFGAGRIPIATPAGAYQDTVNNGYVVDAFIAKFDSTGTVLQWSTYYGGVGAGSGSYEIFEKCTTDPAGNLYFGGRGCDTLTPTFVKSGAYNNDTLGDGIVAKFSNGGVRDWITLFPGQIKDIALDQQMNIYITGPRGGSGLPIKNKGGGVQSANAGFVDAFITEFEPNKDSIIWSTYYGGELQDIAYALAIDDSHSAVYMVGMTRSDTALLVPFPMVDYNIFTSTDFLNEFSSTVIIPNTTMKVADAFIVRFDQNTGAPKWSTFFGGFHDDEARCVTVDGSGSVYVGGFTKSGSTFWATHEKIDFPTVNPSGFYVKPDITGWEGIDPDAWIAVFTPNMELTWTTYYGDGLQSNQYASGNYVMGLAIANDADLYFAGYSTSGYNNLALPPVQYSAAITSDYYQPNPVLNSGDALAARFDISSYNVVGIDDEPETIQDGDLVVFPNPSSNSITILADSLQENAAEIVIYNMLGEVVYRQNVQVVGTQLRLQVDISSFADGVYTVGLTSGTSQSTQRFIKTE